MQESFGIYIHIPYCLQRCRYCDFATYVHTEIMPPEHYISLVKKEISRKKNLFKPGIIDTLYFGGGTPSLVPAHLIVELIQELAKFGYVTGPETEVTIEINPATVDSAKLETYLHSGINRFSVGAQTFSDRLLKMVHREHNALQTIQTLELLKAHHVNFSFDLLFALPTQSLKELEYDVQVAVELGSKHISPYCLTVPENHPLSKNRPLEEDQIEMFNCIHRQLSKKGFSRYEISNYALPGYESKHNMLYWTDKEFWGLGLSAHSYSKKTTWGSRFWNANTYELYQKQQNSDTPYQDIKSFPQKEIEHLTKTQALTDYCYTSLRLDQGLSEDGLLQKFGAKTLAVVQQTADPLISKGLINHRAGHFALSESGFIISNQIFEKFTFLEEEPV